MLYNAMLLQWGSEYWRFGNGIHLKTGQYSITYDVTSNECIAGNGQIPKRSDTSEYVKELYKGSVSLQNKSAVQII